MIGRTGQADRTGRQDKQTGQAEVDWQNGTGRTGQA